MCPDCVDASFLAEMVLVELWLCLFLSPVAVLRRIVVDVDHHGIPVVHESLLPNWLHVMENRGVRFPSLFVPVVDGRMH